MVYGFKARIPDSRTDADNDTNPNRTCKNIMAGTLGLSELPAYLSYYWVQTVGLQWFAK
jgi:hypothetical protein